jgi:Hemingway/CFA97
MWNLKGSSKEIAELDVIKEHFIHRKKLLKIKPRIDNKSPKVMGHLQNKVKKELERLKAQVDIQKDNQLLLKKIDKIKDRIPKRPPSKKYLKLSSRLKTDKEILISDENQRLFTRLQSATSHYSAEKHEKEYLKKKYLAIQLSENARRIPRTISFNPNDMCESISSAKPFKTLRPSTASGSARINGKIQRPMSSKEIKINL